jgi:hypothetical protein
MRSFMICTARQILLGRSNQGGYGAGKFGMYGENRNTYRVLVEEI